MLEYTLLAVGLLLLILVLGRGRRHFRHPLHRAFERLQTSAGQEREIRNILSQLRSDVKAAREIPKNARKNIATALRAERFDSRGLEAGLDQERERLLAFRQAAFGHLGRLHEVLDDEQRERLAGWVESPWRFGALRRRCPRPIAWG